MSDTKTNTRVKVDAEVVEKGALVGSAGGNTPHRPTKPRTYSKLKVGGLLGGLYLLSKRMK